jgi:hypothetical protein
MPQYSVLQQKSFVKGVSASTDIFDQQRGSIPRASNFLLSKRGALKSCDGSKIINQYNGAPTLGRGKTEAIILFQPTGVPSYYMFLAKVPSQPINNPINLNVADGGAGGTIPAGNYYYQVTAIDGSGGETTVSNEIAFTQSGTPHKVVLTWNAVVNAVGYNIYRGPVSGGEGLLVGSNLPTGGNVTGLLATYTDDGTAIEADGVPVALQAAPNGLSIASGSGPVLVIANLTSPIPAGPNVPFILVGATPAAVNGTYQMASFMPSGMASTIFFYIAGGIITDTTGGGGTIQAIIAPPTINSTQQVALFKMPLSTTTVYDDTNIVALFPADPRPIPLPPPGGGGGGGGGTGAGGGSGAGGSGGTPSGGVAGNTSTIPQMVQFANQIAIALGNGFAPQLYADATGTTDNAAKTFAISAISVDAFGNVNITTATPHGLTTPGYLGTNILINGVPTGRYNTNANGASAFVITQITGLDGLVVYNPYAAGSPASAGGTITITTTPIVSTFSATYPIWSSQLTVLVGDLIQPTVANGFYYTCIQSGVTGTTEPTWPTVVGQQVSDDAGGGDVIWQCKAASNTGSPPPPGCGHLTVYAGSLWAWNTWPTNTSNGLDGPTSLRMSDSNNPNSWNPINQAFLDKDDGSEGMGLGSFTVTALGIPPEGSLVVCKNYATYQIIGVFGASNFAIQRIKSDMGCIAPRTLLFAPGFGMARLCHLGIAIFDGVEDKLVSEDIRPYLFPTFDPDYDDITVMDSNWASVAWSTQAASPPMWVCGIPIGNSNGMLTRLLCFDLVLRAWAIVDLPFNIGCLYQTRAVGTNPITVLGSFDDGTLQRWQAGDLQWATSTDGSSVPGLVLGTVTTPEIYNGFPMAAQTGRIYIRQLVVRGKVIDPAAVVTAMYNLQNEGNVPAYVSTLYVGNDGSFELTIALGEKVINARALLSCLGSVEIDSFGWFIKPETTTVPAQIT